MTSADLTVRELAVLRQAALGKPIAEIALDEQRGYETVREQLKWCRIRLGARNNAHAVAIAYQRGLLP